MAAPDMREVNQRGSLGIGSLTLPSRACGCASQLSPRAPCPLVAACIVKESQGILFPSHFLFFFFLSFPFHHTRLFRLSFEKAEHPRGGQTLTLALVREQAKRLEDLITITSYSSKHSFILLYC